MSTFWLIYWICLGTVVILTLICAIFFEIDYDPISPGYVLIFDVIAAIPGIGMLGAVVLVVSIFVMIFDETLTPKDEIFDKEK